MKPVTVITIVVSFGIALAFAPIFADAHQSGCHRWHSCPSDSGSYVCGDLGYYSQCPSTNYPKSEPKSEPKPESPEYTENPIPDWIRNNAEWWAQGAIGDKDFVSGIQYLIKEGIMQIPDTVSSGDGGSQEIPTWIKNNADWWAQGLISDDDFVKGIQYLVQQGIIQV